MRRLPKAVCGAMLVSAISLAGCGSSSDGPATVAAIPFKSTAIGGKTIPARYTCAGRDTPPPLEWGVVPKNTGELALFVVGYVPEPATKTYALSIEWAVAGLSPTLHRLTTERLPFGAFAGVATGGKRTYSICPKRGVSEHYQFLLFAVPSTSAISPRFAGLPVLSALTKPNAGTSAAAEGAFEVIYKRL